MDPGEADPVPVIREFDGKACYAALDGKRRADGLSWPGATRAMWAQTAHEVRCQPGQLTGRKTAPFATEMALGMRITQWIGRPAADFIYPARW